jgi:hypothetical protein
MKVEKWIGRAFAALALTCGLSLPAHAQVGTDWTPTAVSLVTQTSVDCSIVPFFTGIGGIFQIPPGQGLAVDRLQTFPSGPEQFQGDMTVDSLDGDRIAVKGTLMAPSTPWLILGVQKATGGNIFELEDNAVLSPYTIGTMARITTIVSAGPSVTSDVYINGSHVEQKTGVAGPFYDEFGVWTAASGTGSAIVTWQNVQLWTGSVEVPVTITASASGPGTISPSGNVTIKQGVDATFTISPTSVLPTGAPGSTYSMFNVTVDGVNLGRLSSYTFTDVQANHTINATFGPTITTCNPSNGTITVSQSGPGDSVNITIAPDTGYQVSDVEIDGASVGAVTSFTLGNVQPGNHTVCATFVPPTIPTKIPVAGSAVTASSFQSPNVPANTVDGDLATRWSAQGDPQWIQYDLGSPMTINFVKVAVYQGNTCVQTFDFQTSLDGTNFTTVAEGLKSSGTTAEFEIYNLPSPAGARFVRLLCHGNNTSTWNSFTEVEIWGSSSPPPLLPPTNFTASLVTSTSATISWAASTSPGVTGYNCSIPGFTFPARWPLTTGTSFPLTNLTPNTTYPVTVTAIDAAGESSAPATFSFTTLPAKVVPQQPTNLMVTNITSTSATLSWTASVTSGVTGYKVELIPSGSVGTAAATSSVSSNPVAETSNSLTHLTPDSSYDVIVHAIDGLGDSSAPAATSFTTLAQFNRTLTGSSGDGWHALALSPAASGFFIASFDATPTVSLENAVIGLSSGAATADGNLSCIARFNASGQIDAYNGNDYVSTTIDYLAGKTYHFRLAVNVTAHTYSVFVTAPGGFEQIVGSNYAFRRTADTVTSLDHWNLDVDGTPPGSSLTAVNLTP